MTSIESQMLPAEAFLTSSYKL